ncbi:M57 family metalloprotease [Aquimarina sp. MMG016]|uniref:M57 family metalloprotease n=1 Tax=Aquimarina sp. MMG016 TaxID=2822690 RepID=UPI001B39DCBB|nr:M57 family metalloprotease [Aquimarina sp. MMG016]MBQ4819597.1 hypothetical protein [Aquimarina sp. MMG016]
MKKRIKNVFLLTLFFSFLIGCTKDDYIVENENLIQDDAVLETIKSWGFTDDEIEDQGTYYLVDGDMVFYKNKKYNSPINSNTKQRQHPNSVTISTIDVYINPGMNFAWRAASEDAIDRWNAVNSSLQFIITTSVINADIRIMYDSQDPGMTLAPNVFGRGEFPTSNGLPGARIWVNPDFNACGFPITQDMRISNVQHELGHNVGLTHTNQSFGNLIPGTPTTDSQSVMNGGQACSIDDFSTGDINAIAYLFPPVSAILSGVSPICNNTAVTYNLTGAGSTVNWITSPNLQVVSSSNTAITVQSTNSFVSGEAYVEAQFSGQTLRKNLWIGRPRTPTNITFYSSSPCLNQNVIALVQDNHPDYAGVHYEWRGGGHTYVDQNPKGTEVHFTTFPSFPYTTNVFVKATNACGSSIEYSEVISVQDCGGDGGPTPLPQ